MSLAAIQKKAKAKPSIVIIYGPSGLGKTTLAVGSKNPVVLQTEEGLGILTNNRDIPHIFSSFIYIINIDFCHVDIILRDIKTKTIYIYCSTKIIVS